MKKTMIVMMLLLVICISIVTAWTLIENTKLHMIYEPNEITALATATAIDMRGYEAIYVVGYISGDATTTTITPKYYKSATSSGALTLVYTGSPVTVNTGYFELEINKDMNYPFVTFTFTPSATSSIGVFGLLYGATSAPF
mgnify:CR=1 FL=1